VSEIGEREKGEREKGEREKGERGREKGDELIITRSEKEIIKIRRDMFFTCCKNAKKCVTS